MLSSKLYKVISFLQFTNALFHTTHAMPIESGSTTRRKMLGRSMTSTFGGVVCSSGWIDKARAAVPVDTDTTSNKQHDASTTSFSSYQILPDSSANLNPTIKEISSSDLTEILAMTDTNNSPRGGALWLGEHHNSAIDHALQADFVRSNTRSDNRKLLARRTIMAATCQWVLRWYRYNSNKC